MALLVKVPFFLLRSRKMQFFGWEAGRVLFFFLTKVQTGCKNPPEAIWGRLTIHSGIESKHQF